MSQENLEIVRRALPENAPGDVQALLAILDEDVEWDYVGAFPEGVTTYRGPAEVREFLRQWADGFDDFGFEAEEAIDAGDAVVIRLHQWGRGKGTGAPVESRTWQVLILRGGKIAHCRGYESKAQALDAAGAATSPNA
jgi:ketosteroid isomerase-like protein